MGVETRGFGCGDGLKCQCSQIKTQVPGPKALESTACCPCLLGLDTATRKEITKLAVSWPKAKGPT